MALDMERILNQTGETKKEFSEGVGISIKALDNYALGNDKPSFEELEKISSYTGIDIMELGEKKSKAYGIEFDINDTWSPSREAKDSLQEYLSEGNRAFDEEIIKNEIEKIQKCIEKWRKPRISVAGQSDTGKSTLINALIGGDKLPAKWTPTTSIIVYIKHISDKPEFINEDVWIFGKRDGKLWDDTKLKDESYCKKFLVAKGDYSLLKSYGTHQEEKGEYKEAYSAVAFIDSKLLEDCDLLDLPGFAANDEDDALHQFGSNGCITDILIYLSRSNGFLQDRDLDYLNLCVNSLRPIERTGNNIGKLENLFIIAAQAGAVNGGNMAELNEIIDTQSHKLCSLYRKSAEIYSEEAHVNTLLPRRTVVTGCLYSEEDVRARFFTYEMKMPRLCKKFILAFTTLIEKLPVNIHKEFVGNLNNIALDASETIKVRIQEYTKMMEEKESYIRLVNEIKEKEPGRIVKQKDRNEELMKTIDSLAIESKQLVQKFYDSYICESKLIEEIESSGCSNKKSDKQDFVSSIGNVISEKIQSILNDETEKYSKELEEYLDDYMQRLNYKEENNIKVEFDVTNVFALGISALGTLGASAAWLATSFTATIVTLFPELAGWGMFATFGGVITISIGAFVAGLVAIVKAFTWKKDLAKAIIKAYEKEEYLDKILKKIDEYWEDTKSGVNEGAQKVEDEWKKKIEELQSLADEKNVKVIEYKRAVLKRGLDFFEQMPLPEV